VSALKFKVNVLRTFDDRLSVCRLIEGMKFKEQDGHTTVLVVDHMQLLPLLRLSE
jgi:hypothetical protein